MPTLEHNIAAVKLRIESACKQYKRDTTAVTLLAVSKTRPVETVANAYLQGLTAFGENYADEAKSKLQQLTPNIRQNSEWHFIGPIQSNKTRFIANHFDWVQSLDRLKIARRLNEQRSPELPPLQCLIQINISQESQKAGIESENLLSFVEEIHAMPHIQVRGLMSIPKANQSQSALENDFARMATLLKQLQATLPEADTLSMGMSADLELAIKHGATMVRIGTDIFGPREPSPAAQ